MAWKSSLRQNYRTTFSPTVPTSAAGDLSRRGGRGGTWWQKVGTSKKRGKQWQATPKNLPRMQRTRAIPVAWLNSGLCPDRPKGWIPIIIIIIIIIIIYVCVLCVQTRIYGLIYLSVTHPEAQWKSLYNKSECFEHYTISPYRDLGLATCVRKPAY